MPSINQETSESSDSVNAAINFPGFLLALKQIASSSIPPETIKTLLASIYIKEECEEIYGNYQDIVHTLKTLTHDAKKTNYDFKAIKLLLAQISTGKCDSDDISNKRKAEENIEHERPAGHCSDEDPSTSKKFRVGQIIEHQKFTDKIGQKRRKSVRIKSRDNDTLDKNGTINETSNFDNNLDAHEVDNDARTEAKNGETYGENGYEYVPSNSKDTTEVAEAATHKEHGPSTSEAVQGHNNQAFKLTCDLCDMVFAGRLKLDNHYRRRHNLTDPDRVLFFDGKPLIYTSNMSTDGGNAHWFKKEKAEAEGRYKKKPYTCRLCDTSLDEPSLLKTHYEKDHKVKKMYNTDMLFMQARTSAHLADLPSSNPRVPRRPRNSSSKLTENNVKIREKINDLIEYEGNIADNKYNGDDIIYIVSDGDDDESSNYKTTSYLFSSVKTEENVEGTANDCGPEIKIKINEIKTEKGV